MTSQREQEKKEKLENERRISQKTWSSAKKAATGSKIMAPVEAVKLGIYLRSQMGQHAEAVIMIALVLAIAIDFTDMVPIAGWLVTLFVRPLLFVLLWGKGALKVRIIKIILIGIDFAPGLGSLPWSTISVLYVYYNLKKQSRKAEAELGQLKTQFGEAV